MQDYRNLKVWQGAHALTLGIYRATGRFPREEIFGITGQVRRASASICANLAEGCARGSDREFLRYLRIAIGSASELDYHLLLSRDLGLLQEDLYISLQTQLVEVRRMLWGFSEKLRAKS
jgi:four helix bundle protein